MSQVIAITDKFEYGNCLSLAVDACLDAKLAFFQTFHIHTLSLLLFILYYYYYYYYINKT